jgi:hypothetical protein
VFEVFLAFTDFQPSEMMAMSEQELLYWHKRVENSYKRYRWESGTKKK